MDRATRFDLGSALVTDQTFRILDPQGRIEDERVVPRGSGTFLMEGLLPGVHILAVPRSGVTRTFIVPGVR